MVVVAAGFWAVVDVVAAVGVVETIVVVVEIVEIVVVLLPVGPEPGAVAVVEGVAGVVVPVGPGGAPLLPIGVVVLVGPGLGVPLLDVTGGVTWLVGSVTARPVVTGPAGDVLGTTLLGLVVTGLEPAPAESEGPEANPLGDPELAVVGVRPAVVEPVTAPEPPAPEADVPEADVPETAGPFAKLDVTGLVGLDDAEGPRARCPGSPHPLKFG
jgi:hypothetical protein